MKNKKICWIPCYGSISYFNSLCRRLLKINKEKNLIIKYMSIIGGIVMIDIVIGILFINAVRDYFKNEVMFIVVFDLFYLLLIWPSITIPILKFGKKAEQIIEEHNKNSG